jgi:hypothetical protein
MNTRIPITQTPGQAIAITVAMDHPQPIIGPAPHSLRYTVNMALTKMQNAVINTLTVIGWIMGLIAVLAAASPTFEGWIEDVFVRVLYAVF